MKSKIVIGLLQYINENKGTVIAIIMGLFIGFQIVVVAPLTILLLVFSGPPVDELKQDVYERVTMSCHVLWQDVLLYDSLKYNNDFSKVNQDSILKSACEFVVMTVKIYEQEQVGEKQITPTETIPIYDWVFSHEETYTGVNLLAYANNHNGSPYHVLFDLIQDMKEFGSSSNKYSINFTYKELEDLVSEEEYDEAQVQWVEMLKYLKILEKKYVALVELPESMEPNAISSYGLAWPVPYCNRVSSNYGWRYDPIDKTVKKFHYGTDLVGKRTMYSPVIAVMDGTVIGVVDFGKEIGNAVIIEHDDGVTTWISQYYHLNQYEVMLGESVEQGDIIGAVGNTGKSTGPHLHFGLKKNGTFVDPMLYLKKP